jgi:hypothetical protein
MTMPSFTPRVLAAACALLAFWACAQGAGSAAAETAVGIEARGVDPMVALRNSQGLDLRDELGRPVSPKLIAAQLKAAQASASADAAFSSRLPQARVMARALAFWEGLKAALGMPSSRLPWNDIWALPGPKPQSKAGAPGLLILAMPTFSCAAVRCRRTCLPRAATGAPLALRC